MNVITNRKEDEVKDQNKLLGFYVQEVDCKFFIIKI
jgi:hypothetical protein